MTQLVIADLTLQARVTNLVAAEQQLIHGGFFSFNSTTIKQNILNADVYVDNSIVNGGITIAQYIN